MTPDPKVHKLATRSWLVKALDSQSREKTTGVDDPLDGSKVDSSFHRSEVNKMSTRNFWELSGKK